MWPVSPTSIPLLPFLPPAAAKSKEELREHARRPPHRPDHARQTRHHHRHFRRPLRQPVESSPTDYIPRSSKAPARRSPADAQNDSSTGPQPYVSAVACSEPRYETDSALPAMRSVRRRRRWARSTVSVSVSAAITAHRRHYRRQRGRSPIVCSLHSSIAPMPRSWPCDPRVSTGSYFGWLCCVAHHASSIDSISFVVSLSSLLPSRSHLCNSRTRTPLSDARKGNVLLPSSSSSSLSRKHSFAHRSPAPPVQSFFSSSPRQLPIQSAPRFGYPPRVCSALPLAAHPTPTAPEWDAPN